MTFAITALFAVALVASIYALVDSFRHGVARFHALSTAAPSAAHFNDKQEVR